MPPDQEPVTVSRGQMIRIIPDQGPGRVMIVSHVEHHIITLTDLPSGGDTDAT